MTSHFVRMRAWLVVCTLILIGGCAYLDTKQATWIFSPAEGDWRGFRGLPAGMEERWIPVGNRNEKLHAWWSPHTEPNAPVLLYLHGARWNLTGSVTRIPRWNKMGFSVLAIDYRGFGKSVFADGGAISEQSANEDAAAAWATLGTLAPSAKRYIFGHSLGGAMAIQLATNQPDASGLILEGAFTSIPDMLKETKWGFLPVSFLVSQRFDNMARIGNLRMPILIAHGTSDDIVPYFMGERLFAAATAQKRFFKAEGGNHHNLTSAHFDGYERAVREHFRVGSAPTSSLAVGIASVDSTSR